MGDDPGSRGCLPVPFFLKGIVPSLTKSLRLALAAFAALAALAATANAATSGDRPRVLAVEFATDVNPVSADYVVGEIERAEREGYDAIVILLDTPGGLAESMRQIYQAELAARIPVIVYVSPEGARAASAGVWIGQAADVLAMAPQTNIGSSTPIGVGGEEIPEDARNKIVNDAVASIRAIAEEHGRNADWVEEAVREGANLEARRALEENVIDLIAPDLETLLDEADGREAVTKGLALDTANAQVEHVEMSLWKRILNTLINPNIIVLLMSLGALGILIELYNPGAFLPGIVGVISLIVGLFGLQVLPISAAGLLLMIVAVAFFAAEVFVPSGGILSVGGAVAFVIGSLMLFDPAGDAYEVSLWVAVGIAGTTAAFTALVLTKVIQLRRRPAEVGVHGLVGTTAVVRADGQVAAAGERWRAHGRGGAALEPGDEVRVVAVDESTLTLTVEPVDTRQEQAAPAEA
ncbi:MAG TPA: nodulation protein NfeD [Gaiellaceae bacterium]|nr:nodulation protein NfeD [Gaiellaceae bacterium]